MTLYAALIVLLIVAGIMWLIWRYVPEPGKTIMLIVAGIGLLFLLLSIIGVIPMLKSTTI